MLVDWLTESKTLANWQWLALFVGGELFVTLLVRRFWQHHVDGWLEDNIRVGRPPMPAKDRKQIILRECDQIERAAWKFEGAEQRRWIEEHVAAIRRLAGG